jgi:hypothetical protein
MYKFSRCLRGLPSPGYEFYAKNQPLKLRKRRKRKWSPYYWHFKFAPAEGTRQTPPSCRRRHRVKAVAGSLYRIINGPFVSVVRGGEKLKNWHLGRYRAQRSIPKTVRRREEARWETRQLLPAASHFCFFELTIPLPTTQYAFAQLCPVGASM